jgi:hypothetical protein
MPLSTIFQLNRGSYIYKKNLWSNIIFNHIDGVMGSVLALSAVIVGLSLDRVKPRL